MSNYHVGQYRGGSKSTGNGDWSVMESSYYTMDDTQFRDVGLKLSSGKFEKGEDYCVSVDIPTDEVYSIEFNIKLMDAPDNSTGSSTKAYQLVGRQVLPRSSKSDGVSIHRIVLYSMVKDGPCSVAEAFVRPQDSLLQTGVIYYTQELTENDIVVSKYSRYDGDNKWTSLLFVSDYDLAATWGSGSSADNLETKNFKIFFSPLKDTFNTLLLEIKRGTDDYNIIATSQGDTVETDGAVKYIGRAMDNSKIKAQFIKLNKDILPNLHAMEKKNKRTVTRIGVWGPPGLPMMVNHELIRVGKTGYYEYDSIPITDFSVLPGEDDIFTVDYIYTTDI